MKYLAKIKLQKCLARLPESVALVKEAIVGVVGEKERDLSSLGREPIHQKFANWRSGPHDIVEFTKRYGVLDWEGELVGQKRVPGTKFAFLVFEWQQHQNEIRELWEQATGAPHGMWSLLSFTGNFPIAKEADRLSRQFAYSDTSDDEEFIWEGPETIWEPTREGPVGYISAHTTWQYVCLRLTFETWRYLRKCENPDCAAPYFIARRKDQVFCGQDCAHLIAMRRWWSRQGNEWRRARSASKRRKS